MGKALLRCKIGIAWVVPCTKFVVSGIPNKFVRLEALVLQFWKGEALSMDEVIVLSPRACNSLVPKS